MLTCYAEKRACYSLISYKTKKTQSCTDRSGTKIRTVRVRQDSCIYIGSNLFLIERETVHDIRWMSVLHRPEQSGDLEPFESGRTRLYTKGILLGYLLYIKRARDGTRTRDPDLGKVVLHQLSHSRIINKIFISKQVMGIEPTYSAWKADVLPLNYTCVPRTGIEPVTRGFSVLCSTD